MFALYSATEVHTMQGAHHSATEVHTMLTVHPAHAELWQAARCMMLGSPAWSSPVQYHGMTSFKFLLKGKYLALPGGGRDVSSDGIIVHGCQDDQRSKFCAPRVGMSRASTQ